MPTNMNAQAAALNIRKNIAGLIGTTQAGMIARSQQLDDIIKEARTRRDTMQQENAANTQRVWQTAGETVTNEGLKALMQMAQVPALTITAFTAGQQVARQRQADAAEKILASQTAALQSLSAANNQELQAQTKRIQDQNTTDWKTTQAQISNLERQAAAFDKQGSSAVASTAINSKVQAHINQSGAGVTSPPQLAPAAATPNLNNQASENAPLTEAEVDSIFNKGGAIATPGANPVAPPASSVTTPGSVSSLTPGQSGTTTTSNLLSVPTMGDIVNTRFPDVWQRASNDIKNNGFPIASSGAGEPVSSNQSSAPEQAESSPASPSSQGLPGASTTPAPAPAPTPAPAPAPAPAPIQTPTPPGSQIVSPLPQQNRQSVLEPMPLDPLMGFEQEQKIPEKRYESPARAMKSSDVLARDNDGGLILDANGQALTTTGEIVYLPGGVYKEQAIAQGTPQLSPPPPPPAPQPTSPPPTTTSVAEKAVEKSPSSPQASAEPPPPKPEPKPPLAVVEPEQPPVAQTVVAQSPPTTADQMNAIDTAMTAPATPPLASQTNTNDNAVAPPAETTPATEPPPSPKPTVATTADTTTQTSDNQQLPGETDEEYANRMAGMNKNALS